MQGDYVEKYVKLLTVTSIKAIKCILPLLFDSPSYMKYLVSSYTRFIMCCIEDGHCQVLKHVVVPYVVYFLHTSTNK